MPRWLAWLVEALKRDESSGRVTLHPTSRAEPTPSSVIIKGARVDGLAVVPMVLEWCLQEARYDVDW